MLTLEFLSVLFSSLYHIKCNIRMKCSMYLFDEQSKNSYVESSKSKHIGIIESFSPSMVYKIVTK